MEEEQSSTAEVAAKMISASTDGKLKFKILFCLSFYSHVFTVLKSILGIKKNSDSVPSPSEPSLSQTSSNTGNKRKIHDENNTSTPMEGVEITANKKPTIEIKVEAQSEELSNDSSNDSDDDQEEEKETERMKQLKKEMKKIEEEKKKQRDDELKKLANDKLSSKTELKYILIQCLHDNEEVCMFMFRTSVIQKFTKKELIWKLAFFNFPETFTKLNIQFPTLPGEPCPFQFLYEWVEHKKNHEYDFKSCQMVAKFSVAMTPKLYRKLKKDIIDHVNTNPEAFNAPGKKVVLDLQTHNLNDDEFKVIKFLASEYQTRLKTDEEIKMDSK